MLEICKKEIGSIMASLASHDMEEVSRQMEEAEFAATDLESELRSNIFTKYFYKIFNINIISCREDEEKRRRRALKTVDDDGLHDDEDVSHTQVRSGQVNITWLPTAGTFPAVHQAPVPTAGRCQTDQSSGNSRLKRIRQKTQTIIREILQSSNQNNLKLEYLCCQLSI